MVLILKDIFLRRKFFGFALLKKDLILYIKSNIFERLIFLQKEIIFCKRDLCNVLTSCFHFERFIPQKRIRLIDSYEEGLHPKSVKWLIFSQEEILFLSFCRRSFSNVFECRFNIENLFCRRKFFWLTFPQKNFILYMKMECMIINYFPILLQKESSSISKCAL